MRRTSFGSLVLSMLALAAVGASANASTAQASPIKHIVVIFQENHTFDDLLGQLCISEGGRCDAVDQGKISNGQMIPLQPMSDIPSPVGHNHLDQFNAMHGGKLDGWDKVRGCEAPGYACLEQVQPGGVPNLWALADAYTISDRTFETDLTPSWGSHLELVSSTLDGFVGDSSTVPVQLGATASSTVPLKQQVGCDGVFDASWGAQAIAGPIYVPACVPDKHGKGPYRPSPVKYVPTVMDTLDAQGLSWKFYAPGKHGAGYDWSICPTFYECFSTQQHHIKRPTDVLKDGANGTLPNFSIVIPFANESQHNGFSMIRGDNWIGKVVSSIMNGPDWKSTAIFITYDDCGCFYDHVVPPTGDGLRVPMVIVSPFAKPHYVDHHDAEFLSLLSFTEHNFKLPPIPGGFESGAYDYSDAFNFSQEPLAPIPLGWRSVPASSLLYEAERPQTLQQDPW